MSSDCIRHWHAARRLRIRHEAHRLGPGREPRFVRCFAQRPPNAWQLFADAVAARADHEALICGEYRRTWAELEVEVERCAQGLRALGVAPGDRVALLIGNRPQFVIAFWAALRIGAIAVPIGVREQAPGVASLLAHCAARVLLHDEDLAARVPTPRGEATPALAAAVGLAAHEDPGAKLLALAPAQRARVPSESLAGDGMATPGAEDEVAVILYTSGTTGRPKGAMLTHLGIVHSAMHFEICMALGPQDRSALVVPASHVTGLIAMVATIARAQGTLIVEPAFRAADFLRTAARERITHAILVPAMYALCLREPDFDRHDLSAWRVGCYGGAPMPRSTIEALAQRLPAMTPMNAYGATETTSPATVMPPGAQRAHLDSVGVAVPCAEIRVVDDAGREVAPGETGELWIAGPMVVAGYWDDPQASADEFTAGWWHSGDIGAIDADGFVSVFDRKKDMLNRGGYKIFSVEVETALIGFPGVIEAAVVGRPCPVLGERVHAFVHARDPAVTEAALKAHCAERLADYKVPETIALRDEPLPRNANGKLLKRVLRSL